MAESTKRAGAQGEALVLCAGAFVVDEEGRVLLVRRATEPSLGMWSVPGGRVEAGETPAAAAAREVLEETGLEVEVGEQVLTLVIADRYLVHDFAATVRGGELRAGDDASDARWCHPHEVVTMPLSPGLLDELRRLGIVG